MPRKTDRQLSSELGFYVNSGRNVIRRSKWEPADRVGRDDLSDGCKDWARKAALDEAAAQAALDEALRKALRGG